MQKEKTLILNIEKAITGEKERINTLSSAEAVWSLRYALLNILHFKPEQVESFLDRSFLETYGLMRYVRLVKFPAMDTGQRKQYLLAQMFPELYSVEIAENPLERYLYTLKHTKSKEVWQMNHDPVEANLAVQWVFSILFPDASCPAMMQFAVDHEKELLKLFRTMRLGTFYDDVYSLRGNGVLDMAFFSYPVAIQQAHFLDYVNLRLPSTDDAEFEIITRAEENYYDSKK